MVANCFVLQKLPIGSPIIFYPRENAEIPTLEYILFT